MHGFAGSAARIRRSSIEEHDLRDGDAVVAGTTLRLLAPYGGAMACAGRPRWSVGASSRGRRNDADRNIRFRSDRLRAELGSRHALQVPCSSLRRLVGRRSSLADLQPLSPPPLRRHAALWRRQRGALEADDCLSLLRRHRIQLQAGRAGTRLRDLPARRDRCGDERLREPPPGSTRADAPLARPAASASNTHLRLRV